MKAEKTKRKKKVIRIKRKTAAKNSTAVVSNMSEFERRKTELKKQRRLQRIKRKLIIFLFFVVAVSSTITVFKAPFFNIKEIVCVGYERLSEEEILKKAKVIKGNNIFITNLRDIKENLAAIPYVSESNARRIFPNKIKVWVRECKPSFVVKNGNKYAVCDVNTKVLEITGENKENLCEGSFSEAFEPKAGELLLDTEDKKNSKIIECISSLENLGLLNMTSAIDFTDISDIIILYDNRLKIKLGNTNDIGYKLKFIAEVIRDSISEFERATIDYTGEKLYVSQFEEEKPQNPETVEEETTDTDEKKSDEQMVKGKNS